MPAPITIPKRLEKYAKRDTSTGCLIWHGAKDYNGYGRGTMGGKTISIHREVYKHYKGEIPDGLLVLHHCDTPSCVEHEHLFVGTAQDNCDDKMRKGRHSNGKSVHRVTCKPGML